MFTTEMLPQLKADSAIYTFMARSSAQVSNHPNPHLITGLLGERYEPSLTGWTLLKPTSSHSIKHRPRIKSPCQQEQKQHCGSRRQVNCNTGPLTCLGSSGKHRISWAILWTDTARCYLLTPLSHWMQVIQGRAGRWQSGSQQLRRITKQQTASRRVASHIPSSPRLLLKSSIYSCLPLEHYQVQEISLLTHTQCYKALHSTSYILQKRLHILFYKSYCLCKKRRV